MRYVIAPNGRPVFEGLAGFGEALGLTFGKGVPNPGSTGPTFPGTLSIQSGSAGKPGAPPPNPGLYVEPKCPAGYNKGSAVYAETAGCPSGQKARVVDTSPVSSSKCVKCEYDYDPCNPAPKGQWKLVAPGKVGCIAYGPPVATGSGVTSRLLSCGVCGPCPAGYKSGPPHGKFTACIKE